MISSKSIKEILMIGKSDTEEEAAVYKSHLNACLELIRRNIITRNTTSPILYYFPFPPSPPLPPSPPPPPPPPLLLLLSPVIATFSCFYTQYIWSRGYGILCKFSTIFIIKRLTLLHHSSIDFINSSSLLPLLTYLTHNSFSMFDNNF